MNRPFIEDDMADISALLSYLQNENRHLTNERELSVFAYSIALRDGEHGIRVGPLAFPRPLPGSVSDDFPGLIEQQAFFKGDGIKWEYIDPPDRQRLRKLGYRYLFLIVGQEAGGNPWRMPEHEDVLAKIKDKDGALYQTFFADSSYLTGRRIHRNIFLYVFRLPALT